MKSDITKYVDSYPGYYIIDHIWTKYVN